MAGNKSRSKGAKGMLDARAFLRHLLGCRVFRVHQNRSPDILDADLLVDLGTPAPMVRPTIQVKVRKKIPKFLMEALSEDGLGMIREDGGPWLLLTNLSRFQEMADERRPQPWKIIMRNLPHLNEAQRAKLKERL